MLEKVEDWRGRYVTIIDGFPENIGEKGIVLAVDDSNWRPAGWVKVAEGLGHAQYRSVDLCWLEDQQTGETGPVWGSSHKSLKDIVKVENCTVHGDGSQIREINGGVKDWVHFEDRTVEFAGGSEPPTQSYSSNNSGLQIHKIDVHSTKIMDNGDGTFTSY